MSLTITAPVTLYQTARILNERLEHVIETKNPQVPIVEQQVSAISRDIQQYQRDGLIA